MNLRNIQLVCRRELQDQLRDRRTLFMVAVLPLLMYPLMGASFFQLSQFMRGHTARVLMIGADQLGQAEGLPPLVEGERFAKSLFTPASEARRIELDYSDGAEVTAGNRADLSTGKLDVIVALPAGFADQLAELRSRLQLLGEGQKPRAGPPPQEIRVPRPAVLFNSLRESSRIAHLRVDRVLARWQEQIKRKNLSESGVPVQLTKPFQVAEQDLAQGRGRFVGLWSILLPFVMFVWALTGAFYPAIDLCAGEKERGTLETLLSSPASRNEIVWGKLLTVMIFCMATAVLNLAGMATTSQFIAGQLGALSGMSGLTAPPLWTLVWLLVALPPLAALFSALSLACASFARSTKEGQYYFMPLFLALLPLMMIPMAPGVELNLGNSLVPVMGLVLVLQAMLEQRVAEAAPYLLPVSLVTLGCCLLAIKWAVSQFNQESVLFRESERFDFRLWIARAVRDRKETPTAGMAVFAIGIIACLQFFANSLLSQLGLEPSVGSIAMNVILSQSLILFPVLVLTWWLTSRPRASLLLDRMPRLAACIAAGGLALTLHPLGAAFNNGVQQLYPLSPEARQAIEALTKPLLASARLEVVLLLVAVLPAIVEELAFRGFLLSGLRKSLGTTGAIVLSSVAFGVVHPVLQQSLHAVFLGLFLGFLAVKTGSLLPGVIFHGFYNSLTILVPGYAEGLAESRGWALWLYQRVEWLSPRVEEVGLVYPPSAVALGSVVSGAILWWIAGRSGVRSGGDPAPMPSSVGDRLLASKSAE